MWVLVRTASLRIHNLCFEQKYEKYQNFLSENFHFLVVKFSVYLNRHVFESSLGAHVPGVADHFITGLCFYVAKERADANVSLFACIVIVFTLCIPIL